MKLKKVNTAVALCMFVTLALVTSALVAQVNTAQAGRPEWYGAKGDGITDDTRALRACFAAHRTITLSRVYLVTDSISIRSGHFISCDNAVIRYPKDHGKLFCSNSASDWTLSGKLTIAGNRLKEGTAIAVCAEGGKNMVISDMTVQDFAGTAILTKPGKDYQRGNALRLSNTALIRCWQGIETLAASEYHGISNVNVIGCEYAVRIKGGNVTWTGGNIGDNVNGLFVGGSYGTNNAHGIFSGVNINHNTNYNVWCDSVELGQTFIGCHIYGEKDKSIRISESRAISFNGGIIDGRISITGSDQRQHHYLHNVQLDPYFNITPAYTRIHLLNCYTRDGGFYNHERKTSTR